MPYWRRQLKTSSVSIPLISGHQSGRDSRIRPGLLRLNPFDIRASVRTMKNGKPSSRTVSIPLISGHQSGRNGSHNQFSLLVSIPLISGHQSGHRRRPLHTRRAVSIPLISGHQSGRTITRKTFWANVCLNPFDIRASVRTDRD